MSKHIELTQGKEAIVDDGDFERINAHRWYAQKKNNGKFYAMRNTGIYPRLKVVYMAREVMNASGNEETDHVNIDDTLDNRKSNLRNCTHAENVRHRGKQLNSTSGFKGVSLHSQAKRWYARIKINERTISLGLFNAPEDAARAYDDAARKYHGEFAGTNFGNDRR